MLFLHVVPVVQTNNKSAATCSYTLYTSSLTSTLVQLDCTCAMS